MAKKSSGEFGVGPNAPPQCAAKSKRSQEKCRGVAIRGTDPPRCRMHGGTAAVGINTHNFTGGRYSKYLPKDLETLYEDAISNPDILEMAENIGLLETRIKSILLELKGGESMPKWSQVAEVFGPVETALLTGDQEKFMVALDQFHKFLNNGIKWDRAWDNILETMEQLRKVADVEIKRKKELHQMVPIERVMILMAAMATSVKRHVKDPAAITKIIRELAMLQGSNMSGADNRLPPEVEMPIEPLVTRRRALTGKVIDA